MFEEALRILKETLPENHKDIKEVSDNLKNCREAMKKE